MVAQGVLAESATKRGAAGMVVQLGDVGAGRISGSLEAFENARDYLQGFDCPYSTVLGKRMWSISLRCTVL